MLFSSYSSMLIYILKKKINRISLTAEFELKADLWKKKKRRSLSSCTWLMRNQFLQLLHQLQGAPKSILRRRKEKILVELTLLTVVAKITTSNCLFSNCLFSQWVCFLISASIWFWYTRCLLCNFFVFILFKSSIMGIMNFL